MQHAFLNSIGALAAVLTLIIGSAWLFRHFRPLHVKTGGRLKLEGTLALDAKRQLHIVACDGRCVLLLTGTHDLVVGWLPEPSA